MKAVTVRLGLAGKLVDCQTHLMCLQLGEKCLLKYAGCLYSTEVVAYLSAKVLPCEMTSFPKILRRMTPEDKVVVKQNCEDIQAKKKTVSDQIALNNLKIKLIDIEYSFDRSKIICYFSSDGRVDFRSLVLKLARIFKVRIELRQIGSRDHARLVGGLGVCGRKVCCSSHLRKFHGVSIKMAREQDMGGGPENMSGLCGKLLCCLSYEYNQYHQFIKNIYSKGTLLETKKGEGVITEVSLLKQEFKVKLCETGELVLCSMDDVVKIIQEKSFVKSTE